MQLIFKMGMCKLAKLASIFVREIHMIVTMLSKNVSTFNAQLLDFRAHKQLQLYWSFTPLKNRESTTKIIMMLF